MRKIIRPLCLCLAAVLIILALPQGEVQAAETITIEKSELIYDSEGNITANIKLTNLSPKGDSFYIIVAIYDKSRSELLAVYSESVTTPILKTEYSYCKKLDSFPKSKSTLGLVFVWEDNTYLTPRSKEAALKASNLIVDGAIEMEAEDILLSSNKHGAKYTDEDKKLSGGAGVEMKTNAWTIADAKENGASLKKEFILDNKEDAGRFKLWVRARTIDDTASFYSKVNDGAITARYYDDSIDGSYYWVGFDVYINMGVNTIEIYSRTKGIIDKLILTSNIDFKPVAMNDYPSYLTREEQDELWSELFETPPIMPRANVHPRLYLTPEFIPTFKQMMASSDYNANYWAQFSGESFGSEANLESGLSSLVADTDGNNYNGIPLSRLMSRALRTVLGIDETTQYAKTTIAYTRKILDAMVTPDDAGDITRQRGNMLLTSAIVYDWCYPQLSDDDKVYFKDKMLELLASKECGWPIESGSNLANHMGEQEIFRDALAAGIALYDEYPLIYKLAAGKLYQEMIPARKWLRSTGSFDQGNDYGEWRVYNELWADFTIRRMTNSDESIYGDIGTKSIKSLLYNRLPNNSILAVGDSFSNTRTDYKSYPNNNLLMFQLAATLYKDSYMKQEFNRRYLYYDGSVDEYDKFFLLLFDDSSVKAKMWEDMPLSVYSTYPVSRITARTSWQEGVDSKTAVAFMDMHELYIGDHQHKYTGDFQIYYKGLLASNTGVYNTSTAHNEGYSHRGISANTMLVLDPSESFKPGWSNVAVPNDGGQRNPYERSSTVSYLSEYALDDKGKATNNDLIVAKDIKHYIGPNDKTPEISYIGGNLANAYTDKLTDYRRHMVFADTNNEDYPAVFIVYDKITSSDASFKKTWLLHSEEKPVNIANKTIIKREQNGFSGKLVNTTILPQSPEIKIIGGENGEMFDLDGTGRLIPDYSKGLPVEGGKYRIEISPSVPSTDDSFLNAMFVCDSTNNTDLAMTAYSDNNFDGVSFMDKTILFNKSYSLKDSSFSVTIPTSGSVFIVGIEKGRWQIADKVYEVRDDSCSLYFKTDSTGEILISKLNNEADASIINYQELPKNKIGAFYLWKKLGKGKGEAIYTAHPTVAEGKNAYIPIEALEKLGAAVSIGDGKVRIDTTDFDIDGSNIKEINGSIYFYSKYTAIHNIVGHDFPYYTSSNLVVARPK